MLLFRFTQINQSSPEVRIQVHQANAKQQRFAKQMANRQLVVPPNKLQTQQQVSRCITILSTK